MSLFSYGLERSIPREEDSQQHQSYSEHEPSKHFLWLFLVNKFSKPPKESPHNPTTSNHNQRLFSCCNRTATPEWHNQTVRKTVLRELIQSDSSLKYHLITALKSNHQFLGKQTINRQLLIYIWKMSVHRRMSVLHTWQLKNYWII